MSIKIKTLRLQKINIMDFIEYKNMAEKELIAILLKIKNTADELVDRVGALDKIIRTPEWRERRDAIVLEYAVIKNQLKEIHHYIHLGRNEVRIGTFYKNFFCPAIDDCYIHCDAKTNEKDMSVLLHSLYDIDSYIRYYMPKNNVE